MTKGISIYYDTEAVRHEIAQGRHQQLVGGMWAEMGALQLNFLRGQGMKPTDCLLDIGCGSLRLGCLAAGFLEPGNYWGTDISADLIEAGWTAEIVPAGLEPRIPRGQLQVDGAFTFAGVTRDIDYAIATSVFTHLPLNHLRLCFANLARHLAGGATARATKVYFTIFMPQPDLAPDAPCPQKDGVQTYSWKDPYHYDLADLHHAFRGLPWDLRPIGDWNHPRNQMMIEAILKVGDGN